MGLLNVQAFQDATHKDAPRLRLKNIEEAIRGYIAALEADGLPVPEEKCETMVV